MKTEADIQILLSMSEGSGEVSFLVDESGKNNHVYKYGNTGPEWTLKNESLLFGNNIELSLPIMNF